MSYPIFILKRDWYVTNYFLGKSTKSLIFTKGKEFHSTDGIYKIEWENELLEYTTDEMREVQEDGDTLFQELLLQDLKISIEELPQDDDEVIKDWRIQLDVKTSRRKLSEIQRLIEEYIKPIL